MKQLPTLAEILPGSKYSFEDLRVFSQAHASTRGSKFGLVIVATLYGMVGFLMLCFGFERKDVSGILGGLAVLAIGYLSLRISRQISFYLGLGLIAVSLTIPIVVAIQIPDASPEEKFGYWFLMMMFCFGPISILYGMQAQAAFDTKLLGNPIDLDRALQIVRGWMNDSEFSRPISGIAKSHYLYSRMQLHASVRALQIQEGWIVTVGELSPMILLCSTDQVSISEDDRLKIRVPSKALGPILDLDLPLDEAMHGAQAL